MKRYRQPVVKKGEIKVKWASDGGTPCLVYAWGEGLRKQHIIPLLDAFERAPNDLHRTTKSLAQELEDNGFDITTLRFTIKKKVTHEA